jgi:hypothetical protein
VVHIKLQSDAIVAARKNLQRVWQTTDQVAGRIVGIEKLDQDLPRR